MRSSLHLGDELRHGLRHLRQMPLPKGGIDVCFEQQARSLDAPFTVRTELAPAEDETRQKAQNVVSPRSDRRLVEVVDVEDDRRAFVRSEHRATRRGAIDPEVLEVRIAAQPALAGRTFAQCG